MTSKNKTSPHRITLERTFDASLDDVWDLWTTKDGIESWWGPEGFTVTVSQMDLRPGGQMRYAMTATGAEQIAFMNRAGMLLTTEVGVTFTEIVARKRVAYRHRADFVPGVDPYDVDTVVDLATSPEGVRMVLTIDSMHDETWTRRAVMGWESELGKLSKLLLARNKVTP